jgi:TPR repeat protein
MTWREISVRPWLLFNLGVCLDQGEGLAAPDHPAAAGWYKRAAGAGDAAAASALSNMYILGRGGSDR